MPKFLSSGEFYSLATAFTWAVAVMFFRKSGEQVKPVALNLFKDGFGLVLFLISLPVVGVPLFPSDQSASAWGILLLSGLIGIGIADTMFFASLNRLGAANSAIVDCLYSPFVVLSAFVYLHEPLGASLLIAIALMVGAILLGTWEPSALRGKIARKEIIVGIVLGISSMFLMSVGIVIAKPVLAHSNAWWATTVRLIGGVAFLSLQAMTRRHRADAWFVIKPSKAWLYTVPGAVIGAYVSLLLWILGMKYTQASISSVLNQLSTIFILILAWLVLKERITTRKAIAIVMAFGGAVIVTV